MGLEPRLLLSKVQTPNQDYTHTECVTEAGSVSVYGVPQEKCIINHKHSAILSFISLYGRNTVNVFSSVSHTSIPSSPLISPHHLSSSCLPLLWWRSHELTCVLLWKTLLNAADGGKQLTNISTSTKMESSVNIDLWRNALHNWPLWSKAFLLCSHTWKLNGWKQWMDRGYLVTDSISSPSYDSERVCDWVIILLESRSYWFLQITII